MFVVIVTFQMGSRHKFCLQELNSNGNLLREKSKWTELEWMKQKQIQETCEFMYLLLY